jgi:hypothetical protein
MARIDKTKTNPGWWTEKHTSNWDHVKAAFERDWEQTKADFSNGSGAQLNQNVSDTVKQSTGSEPIPPPGVKTRPTEHQAAFKEEEQAHETTRASEKISAASHQASEAVAREHGKIDAADARRDDAAAKWRHAEHELRYGYSVRSQYPSASVWDDTLEAKLRGEWEGMKTGSTWDASRAEIHHGWDYAGKSA